MSIGRTALAESLDTMLQAMPQAENRSQTKRDRQEGRRRVHGENGPLVVMTNNDTRCSNSARYYFKNHLVVEFNQPGRWASHAAILA